MDTYVGSRDTLSSNEVMGLLMNEWLLPKSTKISTYVSPTEPDNYNILAEEWLVTLVSDYLAPAMPSNVIT
jgi:hypothetical protein